MWTEGAREGWRFVALLAVRGTAYHHWSHVIDWLHWFGVTSQDLGGGIDTTPWMNALSGHLTSLARLWLLRVLLTCFTRGEQISFFFFSLSFRPPLCHSCPARPWPDNPLEEIMLDISVSVPGWAALFLNAAHVEIHVMSFCSGDECVCFNGDLKKKKTPLSFCLSCPPLDKFIRRGR